jgi:hypothetical protein
MVSEYFSQLVGSEKVMTKFLFTEKSSKPVGDVDNPYTPLLEVLSEKSLNDPNFHPNEMDQTPGGIFCKTDAVMVFIVVTNGTILSKFDDICFDPIAYLVSNPDVRLDTMSPFLLRI